MDRLRRESGQANLPRVGGFPPCTTDEPAAEGCFTPAALKIYLARSFRFNEIDSAEFTPAASLSARRVCILELNLRSAGIHVPTFRDLLCPHLQSFLIRHPKAN